jgi:hypothetical protein
LSLLNTKYIISPQPLDVPGIPQAISANGLYVYRNPTTLPWYYLASQYVVEKNEDAIFGHLLDPSFDPSTTPIVETELPGLATRSDETANDIIDQKTYDSRRGFIELEVTTDGPRLLVVSENFHPFWEATINGTLVPLVRVNYVWKGVVVPAGKNTVQLTYKDPIAIVCRWISLLSIICLIGAFGWLHFWPQRKANHS